MTENPISHTHKLIQGDDSIFPPLSPVHNSRLENGVEDNLQRGKSKYVATARSVASCTQSCCCGEMRAARNEILGGCWLAMPEKTFRRRLDNAAPESEIVAHAAQRLRGKCSM